MSTQKPTPRTVKVELLLAKLASLPLMEESVFHSVKFLDGKIEKEVCDLLLMHRKEALIVQVKAQGKSRNDSASRKWAAKQFPSAASQVAGARRTLTERPTWCQHKVSGRVDFAPQDAKPRHGLVLLECEVEAVVEPAVSGGRDLQPPFTVMSIKDFLYVVHYLRTWRDIAKYLDARFAVLRAPDDRTIGNELALIGYYTAMGDSFRGCSGIADARIVAARGQHVEPNSAFRDRELHLASILEDLMQRIPKTTEMQLPGDVVAKTKVPFVVGQAAIRDELCHLTIQERAAIGEQIGHMSGRLIDERPAKPLYGAVRFNRHPDRVYMIVVAADANHADLSATSMEVTIAACVHYSKSVGITFVLNQIGDELRFNLAKFENVQWDAEMAAAGQEYFGHIRPRTVGLAR